MYVLVQLAEGRPAGWPVCMHHASLLSRNVEFNGLSETSRIRPSNEQWGAEIRQHFSFLATIVVSLAPLRFRLCLRYYYLLPVSRPVPSRLALPLRSPSPHGLPSALVIDPRASIGSLLPSPFRKLSCLPDTPS